MCLLQSHNRKNLRKKIRSITQPAIPHLGVFLGDIVFINDGNDTIRDSKINWTKCTLLANRIRWINMFQQTPFNFAPVKQIHEYFESKMKILNDNILYQLSLELEPRQK